MAPSGIPYKYDFDAGCWAKKEPYYQDIKITYKEGGTTVAPSVFTYQVDWSKIANNDPDEVIPFWNFNPNPMPELYPYQKQEGGNWYYKDNNGKEHGPFNTKECKR